MKAEVLYQLSAVAAAAAIRAGEISSQELVDSCLQRISQLEDRIHAWAHLDPDYALEQAQRADDHRRAGKALGRLHGVPVGVKDIFDTNDMPTENGTPLHAGRRPLRDAGVVAQLRQAGAVIMGKTVSTELAFYAPGKTTNPHDPARTPGGSSSGSAAAVAAQMVPLSIGSQTNGSIIRPASYCGVCGFKPSQGLISRRRMLTTSRRLDQVGVFANSLEDAALAAEQIMGFDDDDPDMRPLSHPALSRVLAEEPPVPPRFAFVTGTGWDQVAGDYREGLAELVAVLGVRCAEKELSDQFRQAVGWHQTIMEADQAFSFEREYRLGKDRLSKVMCETLERGRRHTAVDYNRALAGIPRLNAELDGLFADYDVIVTPAVTGEAPSGLASTGSPVCCTLWTLCGLPALSLPLLQGANDMPIGVQLVAARGDDARLLRTARWLVGAVAG